VQCFDYVIYTASVAVSVTIENGFNFVYFSMNTCACVNVSFCVRFVKYNTFSTAFSVIIICYVAVYEYHNSLRASIN
jgi:hypothetical protein